MQLPSAVTNFIFMFVCSWIQPSPYSCHSCLGAAAVSAENLPPHPQYIVSRILIPCLLSISHFTVTFMHVSITPKIIWVIQRGVRWSQHVTCMGEKRNTHRFWWQNLKKQTRWKMQDKGEDNFKMDLQQDGRVWTELIWLRIVIRGGLLWIWYSTLRFHKIWESSWLAEEQLASQEWLYSL
jgi:hypothetical protein